MSKGECWVNRLNRRKSKDKEYVFFTLLKENYVVAERRILCYYEDIVISHLEIMHNQENSIIGLCPNPEV